MGVKFGTLKRKHTQKNKQTKYTHKLSGPMFLGFWRGIWQLADICFKHVDLQLSIWYYLEGKEMRQLLKVVSTLWICYFLGGRIRDSSKK